MFHMVLTPLAPPAVSCGKTAGGPFPVECGAAWAQECPRALVGPPIKPDRCSEGARLTPAAPPLRLFGWQRKRGFAPGVSLVSLLAGRTRAARLGLPPRPLARLTSHTRLIVAAQAMIMKGL